MLENLNFRGWWPLLYTFNNMFLTFVIRTNYKISWSMVVLALGQNRLLSMKQSNNIITHLFRLTVFILIERRLKK